METVNWKIEGMSCTNCVLTIRKYLEKEGLQNIKLSLLGGDLSFDRDEGNSQSLSNLKKGIASIGYRVAGESGSSENAGAGSMNRHLRYLLICLPFTLLMIWDMQGVGLPAALFMNPWAQLLLCLPVYGAGMHYFGRSAYKSLRNGIPNMNVLITLGATAAFVYSLTGTLLGLGEDYLFYETAAAIITLIFFGNYLEDISIRSTQRTLHSLGKSQDIMANMIAFDDRHQELVFPVSNSTLRAGDLVLIRSGEKVPADCKILWGAADVDEGIITGESLPVGKKAKDQLIGGSLLIDGTVKAQVIAAGKDSTLAGIINLVARAQADKPPIQQMADRISAIFVPVVLCIALVTLLANYFIFHAFTPALMRSIAVLVIACPCAMGLATPAAIAVGIGRAAKKGILFRNARSLELFRNIRQIVFDKTGTLTTGEFEIADFGVTGSGVSVEEFKRVAWSLEKYSNHPVARSIVRSWKSGYEIKWSKIEEIKGQGMKARSGSGDLFRAGSSRLASATDDLHDVYISKNAATIGWIDLRDQVRPEAAAVIAYCKKKGIKTILLSGDRLYKCREVGNQLGIDEVIGNQRPEQKLEQMNSLCALVPTAMVGEGINDAPALAKATIGISLSEASQIAIQTADLVLMNRGLKNLPTALQLGRLTFQTIKQNLFWAFFYNVIAIPLAAFGLLKPALAAFIMGLSDLMLAANSARLYVRKLA